MESTSASASSSATIDDLEWSMFQVKYVEFVEDALGALPEYHTELQHAKELSEKERMERFQVEVPHFDPFQEENEEKWHTNPKTILPGVVLTDEIWTSLSDGTKQAIWEHLRVLTICCMMEATPLGSDSEKPAWMEDMMKEMKSKWESVDMSELMKKFSAFFSSQEQKESDEKNVDSEEDTKNGFSFPKLPERFLKGQLAKLAQEIVKDITPEDLGISKEQIAECEKNPSNAFSTLFSTFTKNPGILQRTISKIGKRLQQKIISGAIRPQEIAREAEELMKEFAGNASFVDMMEGLKGAFGMEDMDTARAAGKESSARLSMVRDRLRKKLEKRQAMNPTIAPTSSTTRVPVSKPPTSKKKK